MTGVPSQDGRLLVVVPHATRTGSTRALIELLEVAAPDLGVPVAVALRSDGPLAPALRSLGPAPDPLERPAAVLGNTCLTAEEIGDLDPSIPAAVYVHEAADVLSGLPEEALRGLRRADLVLAVSEQVSSALAALGLDPDRVEVLPPPVGDQRAVPPDEVQRCRRDLGVAAGQRLVLGCGEASHRKGTDLFVEMAARLRHRDDIRFAWVGRRLRSVTRMLAHDVEALGIGDRLRWVEEVADPSPYFAAADALVMTSRSDPQPLVPLEAAAQGCPTVGFAVDGIAELADEGSALAEPFPDVVALASAVERTLDDPAIADALVRRARRRLAARGGASIAPRFVTLVGALLAGADHRSHRP